MPKLRRRRTRVTPGQPIRPDDHDPRPAPPRGGLDRSLTVYAVRAVILLAAVAFAASTAVGFTRPIPNPPPPAAAEPPDLTPHNLAAGHAVVTLTAGLNLGDATARAEQVDGLAAAGVDLAGCWAGSGAQYTGTITPVSVRFANGDRGHGTVVAAVQTFGVDADAPAIRYWSVPVWTDGVTVATVGCPALVAPPDVPADPVDQTRWAPIDDPSAVAAVDGFLTAYLSGGDLSRYLADGAAVTPLPDPVDYLGLRGDPTRSGEAEDRMTVLAEARVRDPLSAAEFLTVYRIGLVYERGDWYVRTVNR